MYLREQVVEMSLAEADTDSDGYLKFDEFVRTVSHSDLKAKLTINF